VAGARIAVIDDDPSHIELLKIFLGDEGYAVVVHNDLRDAVAFIKQERPALILLDLMQGHRPMGVDVVRQLKHDPHTRDLPIIIVSADAHVLREHAAELRNHGVNMLDKPYSLDELLALIHDSVQLRGARATSQSLAPQQNMND
jgi:DNA-binding response OmpR family regulator